MLIICLLLVACSSAPLEPYTTAVEPLILVPVDQAGVADKRARFREIFCAVLEQRGEKLPDYLPCEDALARVGQEPTASGKPVALGMARTPLVAVLVPGVGWECFSAWVDLQHSVAEHVRQFGYEQVTVQVDTMSGIETNARMIRDGIMTMQAGSNERNLVLIGYSKGAPDILEALVEFPEIHNRIAAVVSAAGAIGGSALANDASQSQVELLRHWPGAECDSDGDGGTVASLRPSVRKNWMANHLLPENIPYYSLVTYPDPNRISLMLNSSYKKLSRIAPRNDGQLLFYDQVIPGSTLMGYLNADHWALAVPIARSHSFIGATVVDQNHYPREALLESVLRFIEEDLAD